MPMFEYPKFYIKYVGGAFTITHRLTHTFIETVDTEKELVERVKYWVGLSEEELWEFLLYKRYVSIPSRAKRILAENSKKDDNDAEHWFRNAWSIYTDLFYINNQKLLVEQSELPYEVINKIRRERYEQEKEAYKKEEERRRLAEEKLKEEERRLREEERRKKGVVEEVPEGKIGSLRGLEKLKRKKKVKKLKVKTTARTSVDLVESLNPFDF